jgi:hypothetical protein
MIDPNTNLQNPQDFTSEWAEIPQDDMEYNEYNDPDATSCAEGDYNTWEENQVFMDNEFE